VTELEEEEPEKKKWRKSVESEDDEIVELPKPRSWAKKVVQDDGEVQEVKPSRRSSARAVGVRSCPLHSARFHLKTALVHFRLDKLNGYST